MDITTSDPLCKESNARFTMVPLKPSCARRVQRCVCVNLSKPSCKQLQISMCAVYSLNSTQRTVEIATECMRGSVSFPHKSLNSTKS